MKILAVSVVALSLASAAAISSSIAAPGPDRGAGHRGGPGGGPGTPGGLFHRLGEGSTTRVLEMMSERLDLSAEQKAQIQPILEDARQQLRTSAESAKEVLQQTRDKIDAVLTPEQKGKAGRMREAVAAGVGGYLKAHGPELREKVQNAGQEMRLRAALSTLDLSDEQRGRLQELEKSVRERREAVMEKVRPEMEQLQKDVKTSLTEVLTPEQQGELKARMEMMPKGPGFHARRGDGPRGPEGPGPGGPSPERRPRGPRGPQAQGEGPGPEFDEVALGF